MAPRSRPPPGSECAAGGHYICGDAQWSLNRASDGIGPVAYWRLLLGENLQFCLWFVLKCNFDDCCGKCWSVRIGLRSTLDNHRKTPVMKPLDQGAGFVDPENRPTTPTMIPVRLEAVFPRCKTGSGSWTRIKRAAIGEFLQFYTWCPFETVPCISFCTKYISATLIVSLYIKRRHISRQNRATIEKVL